MIRAHPLPVRIGLAPFAKVSTIKCSSNFVVLIKLQKNHSRLISHNQSRSRILCGASHMWCSHMYVPGVLSIFVAETRWTHERNGWRARFVGATDEQIALRPARGTLGDFRLRKDCCWIVCIC